MLRSALKGARDTIPLLIAAVPFGTVFGAIAVQQAGLSTWGAQAMSLLVFAGSSQFVAVGLLAQGVGAAVVIMTTLVVNVRHLLYGLSLAPHMRGLPRALVAALAFWLTDETFAVVGPVWQAGREPHPGAYHLGSSLAMYINWNVWTAVGILAGERLSALTTLGLDFAMVVTFIGIVVPLVVTVPMAIAALTAGLSAVLLHGMAHGLGLILAMLLGIGAGWTALRGRGPRG